MATWPENTVILFYSRIAQLWPRASSDTQNIEDVMGMSVFFVKVFD